METSVVYAEGAKRFTGNFLKSYTEFFLHHEKGQVVFYMSDIGPYKKKNNVFKTKMLW